ncbi:hypothetical protein BU17DRAFT_100164 [Hysterangium stoloniferum]|nr:hypothetical protein BU17DRAFT_100164 [Hysterangium stoloniferum]
MIAPITGKLRKRLWTDLTVAIGLGVAGGYAYWYGIHLKALRQKEAYYLKLENAKLEASR